MDFKTGEVACVVGKNDADKVALQEHFVNGPEVLT